MAQIRVALIDHTGSKKTLVELPDDVPMDQLIPALVTSLNLPIQQGGNPVTYRLDHPTTGRRLADEETLANANIGADAILSLLPEVTAGGGHHGWTW